VLLCARQEELANLESNVAELDARGARLDAAAARTQEEASAKAAEQKEDKATVAALKKQHQTLADDSRHAGLKVSVLISPYDSFHFSPPNFDPGAKHAVAFIGRIDEGTKKVAEECGGAGKIVLLQADQVKAELEEVEGKLREAKADAKESERDRRLVETVEALKRTFSGVRGRLVDLVKVPQRKHNLAVTVALGRHMDAIVVDDDKTGTNLSPTLLSLSLWVCVCIVCLCTCACARDRSVAVPTEGDDAPSRYGAIRLW
jgi:hypothetical protein